MKDSGESAYGEVLLIFTISCLMHCYGFKKEEIETLTMSQISTLFEMYGCMKNPEGLKKYKKMTFNSGLEFEQYLLQKMKFI